MECVLTIDQGNTAVKYTLFDSDGSLLHTCRTDEPDLDTVASLGLNNDIGGAIYASVAGLDLRFTESVRCLCNERLLVLTPATPVPIANHYATPATLGADRLAAAVGASVIFPGQAVLVADAGSALTCDLVSPEPAFLGGVIAPGVKMRLSAMHAYTSRLPLVEWPVADPAFEPFPAYTPGALRAGALLGTAAQIADSLAAAKKIFPDCRLLLTGGDASILCLTPQLKELNPICQPALVDYGLNRIYHYNETKI